MPGGLLQSLSTNSAQLMARATSVCTSHACQTAATSILNDLNVNIDPCSDFYQYTCKFKSCLQNKPFLNIDVYVLF
jgi:hypothetical protein